MFEQGAAGCRDPTDDLEGAGRCRCAGPAAACGASVAAPASPPPAGSPRTTGRTIAVRLTELSLGGGAGAGDGVDLTIVGGGGGASSCDGDGDRGSEGRGGSRGGSLGLGGGVGLGGGRTLVEEGGDGRRGAGTLLPGTGGGVRGLTQSSQPLNPGAVALQAGRDVSCLPWWQGHAMPGRRLAPLRRAPARPHSRLLPHHRAVMSCLLSPERCMPASNDTCVCAAADRT